MRASILRLISPLLFVSVAALLGGCAAPASREAMQATPAVSVQQKSPHSVSVRTSGGSETGAMGSSSISDEDLKAAIEASISQTGVFNHVIQGSGADYELSVSLIRLSKPLMGFAMTVDMETAWSLVKASDRSVVLRKSISSTYTAGMGDAIVGVTRLRMAVEGAARTNITQGLSAIGELKL